MIIRKYGIALHRLKQEHIELVRVKRNSTEIRENMFYTEHITREMQRDWFEKVNNIYNYYFIIEYENELIGITNGKNVDYEKGEAEGGMFIWEKKYIDSYVPVIVSVCMADLSFNILRYKRTYADVKETNQRLISYISQLGYSLHSREPESGKLVYMLTKEDYFNKADKMRKLVMKIGRDDTPLSADDFDLSTVTKEERKLLYTGLPDYLQKAFDEKIEFEANKNNCKTL